MPGPGRDVFGFVAHFTVLLGLPLLGWCLSCKGVSIAGGLLAATIYSWKLTFGKSRELRKLKERQQHELLFKDEKSAIQQLFKDIPPWVFFPDIERVEWINKIVCKLWPDITCYVRDYIMNDLEEKIQKSLPTGLKSLRLSKVDLGDQPPRITGVKVYDLVQDVVVIDMDIFYAGDMAVSIIVCGVKAGVKDFQLNGKLRLELKPLLSCPPFVGGLQMFFITTPEVKFNLTHIAKFLEIPGISNKLMCTIQTSLNNCIVLPNKITVPFASRENVPALRYVEPKGVLKVQLLEAKDLVTKDLFTETDPYVTISVGAEQRESETVSDSSNPVWQHEVHYFIVEEVRGQELQMQMFDKDKNADDALGRVCFSLSSIAEDGYIDIWKDLADGEGSLQFILTWYQLKPQLPPVTVGGKIGSQPAAVLSVFIDSAKDLQRQEVDEEPSSFVNVSVGADEKRGGTVDNTPNPIYDQNFHFLLDESFHLENLKIMVCDVDTEEVYGEVTKSLSDVTAANGMVVHRPHSLTGGAGIAKLLFRASVKYLIPPANEGPEPQAQQTGNPASKTEDENAPTPPAEKEGTTPRKRNVEKPVGEAGDIQITLTYEEPTLTVHVLKCSNLPSSDSEEGKAPDPYIKLRLSSDSSQKYKTEVCDDSFDPTFNEKFEFDLSNTNLADESIEITVKHYGSVFRKVEIGCATIPLSDINQSTAQWYPLSLPEYKS